MRKRGLKKKAVAADLMIEIFQALAAIAIVLVLVAFADNVVDKGALSKEFYTKDIALLITSLHAVPGNLVYYYTIGTERLGDQPYNLKIGDNLVEFSTERLRIPSRFWYLTSDFLQGPSVDIKNSTANRLRFTKDDNGVQITPITTAVTLHLDRLSCPDVETVNLQSVPILVDADDNAFITAQNFVSRFNRPTAQMILQKDQQKSREERQKDLQDAPDTALLFRFEQGSGKIIKALYREGLSDDVKAQSVSLGCNILNQFLEDGSVDVVLLPIHAEETTLPNTNVGLTLVIGQELLDPVVVGQIVFDGTKVYGGTP